MSEILNNTLEWFNTGYWAGRPLSNSTVESMLIGAVESGATVPSETMMHLLDAYCLFCRKHPDDYLGNDRLFRVVCKYWEHDVPLEQEQLEWERQHGNKS